MQYSHIALTAREDFPNKEEVLSSIVKIIEGAGATVCVDAKRCAVPSLKTCDTYEQAEGFDLIVVAGGDGTIISTVRELKDLSTPILGIHYGTLGFLTSIESGEMETELPKLLKGEGTIDERSLLEVSIEEDGKREVVGRALNEAVIGQGGISRLIRLHTKINGQDLTTFRSDGVILATPTGSTAYSLAAGGAIVDPHVAKLATILTPINPHSLQQKPLVIPGDKDISVEVLVKNNAYRTIEPVLTIDGQKTQSLKTGQVVHVTGHAEHARFLRKKDDSFYKMLREKLQWG